MQHEWQTYLYKKEGHPVGFERSALLSILHFGLDLFQHVEGLVFCEYLLFNSSVSHIFLGKKVFQPATETTELATECMSWRTNTKCGFIRRTTHKWRSLDRFGDSPIDSRHKVLATCTSCITHVSDPLICRSRSTGVGICLSDAGLQRIKPVFF